MKFEQKKAEACASGQKHKSRFLKWIFMVSLTLGIPSFLLFGGLFLLCRDMHNQEIQKIWQNLEEQLDDAAYQSSAVRFFQPEFKNIFLQLKGLPANSDSLNKVISEFNRQLSGNALEIYLFDGNSQIIKTRGANSTYELLFSLLNSEIENCAPVTEEEIASLSQLIPFPQYVLKNAREQHGAVIEIGNPDRFSYCYFDVDKSLKGNMVAGILVFIHGQNLNHSQIFNKTVSSKDKNRFGYMIENGTSKLPQTLKGFDALNLLDYYKQHPTNRFILKNKVVLLKRFDEYTLLVGAQDIPSMPVKLVVLSLIFFLIVTFFLLKHTYRSTVLLKQDDKEQKYRVFGIFSLSFALPIVVSMFLVNQYLNEYKTTLFEESKQEDFRRLSEIDVSFDRFITSRLLDLRKFTKNLSPIATDVQKLRETFHKKYLSFNVDSMHLVASSGKILYSNDLLTAEIRRHSDKSRAEREAIFNSWKSRQANLTSKHIKALLENSHEGANLDANLNENGFSNSGFVNLLKHTCLSAMEFWNHSKGITSPIKKSGSDLVVGTLIESQTQSLFAEAKTNISKFTYIQGINEIHLGFLDVIPGPSKEAWYGTIIFTDLVNFERQFLELFFISKNQPGFDENQQKLVSGEDIRAISTHQFAVNFPDLMEFKNFQRAFKRQESHLQNFTMKMKINGQESIICALKCSFLKHYQLLKITPVAKIEAQYNRIWNLIAFCYFIIILIGLSLGWLLNQSILIPVAKLNSAIKHFAEGKFNEKIEETGTEEFDSLASEFNAATHFLVEEQVSEKITHELIQQKEARFGSFLISPIFRFSSIAPQAVVNYFPLKHGGFLVAIFEVVNETRETSTLAAMLKSSVRLLCLKFPDNPASILQELNKTLLPYQGKGHLITGFIGIVDVTNDTLKCANAGQTFPISLGNDGIQQLSIASSPLGIIPKAKFSNHEVSLKGKSLFLFTQGVINLQNQEQAKLGSDGLVQIIESANKANQKEIAKEIDVRLRAFSEGVTWLPDYILLHIRSGI